MAREKVSNEIIAQVLTQAVSNLEKALREHQGKVEATLKTSIKVDATDMKNIRTEINAENTDFKQFLNNHLVKLKETEKPLKTAQKVSLYTMLSAVAFAIGVGLIVYFKTSADSEEKMKAKFIDEVLFKSEQKENFMKLYDRWKNEQTP